MQQKDHIKSFDDILDAKYGAAGTAGRETFRKEAAGYCSDDSKDTRRQATRPR